MKVTSTALSWIAAVVLVYTVLGLSNLHAAERGRNRASASAPEIKVRSLFESAASLQAAKSGQEAKSGPVIQTDPDPNLQRFQFRCRREADWPDACPQFNPAQIYPEVSASDYAFGMYTDFDGETPSYQMTYTDSAGGTETVNFTLDPSFCGSGGYSYYLLFQTTRCAYGGIYIAFLYPHARGRLTATVKAQTTIVFYQLLDVMPHVITKAGGLNGDGQHGLLNTALRGPLSMVMKDFEGNIPHYPVRSDASSNGSISYSIAGPAHASGMSVSGSLSTGDGTITANAVLGSKTGTYTIAATHSDSSPMEAPFNALGVEREDPDDNDENKEGNGDDECVADPITIGIGNSFQQETDYVRSGLSLLEFTRSYNALGSKSSLMRNYWTTTFDRAVLLPQVAGAPTHVRRPDGRVIPFSLANGMYTSVRPYFHGTLLANGSGWKYITEDNTSETYDAQGRLLTIADARGRTLTTTYNAKGNLTKVTANTGGYLSFAYNTYNQVASMTDHVGRTWTYTYNGFSNLVQVKEPDGLYRSYFYQALASPFLLTGISVSRDPAMNAGWSHVTWEYDVSGRAIANYFKNDQRRYDIVYHEDGSRTVTDALGNSSTYLTQTINGRGFVDGVIGPGFASCGLADSEVQRDANMNVTSRTAFGRTTQFGDYDSKGQFAYKIEAAGTPAARQTNYVYDPRFIGKPTLIVEPSVSPGRERQIQRVYNAAGDLTQETVTGYTPAGAPVSRQISYQYAGPLGQLSQIDGPRTDVADITRFEYSPTTSRLSRIIDANGIIVRSNLLYTATGQIASEDRGNGTHVAYAYYPGTDLLQSVTETGAGATKTAAWTYDDRRRVASLTFNDGSASQSTSFSYNDAGDLLVVYAPGVGRLGFTVDKAGNRIRDTYREENYTERRWLQRTFDAYGRVKSLINPTNQVTYDVHPDGTMSSMTDGRNNVVSFTYDDFKRLTTTLHPGQTTSSLAYDSHDRVIQLTDGNQATTSDAYDDLGNNLQNSSPDTGLTTFTHDGAGNVVGSVDALGQSAVYVYDAGNRLRSIDRVGSADDENYVYDTCLNGSGLVCSITNGIGDFVNYEYDGLGRIAKINTNAGSVGYKYDASDNVVEITYPSQRRVLYTRNAIGQVTGVSVVDGGATYGLANNIAYLPFGPASGWQYGNGVVETRQYDTQYRPTLFASGTRSSVSYGSYDGNSNPLQRTVNGDIQTFTYDVRDRLDTAYGLFGVRDYDYDGTGNRLQLIKDGQPTTYAYAPQSNRLLSETVWAYTTDANGNETRRVAANGSGWDLTYTAKNRLLGVTDAQNASTLYGAYRYNALGQRTVKVTQLGDTRFVYGLAGELLAELTPEGGVTQEYVYLNNAPLALLGVPAVNTPTTVDQTIDNGQYPEYCTSASSNKAINGSYLKCSYPTDFVLSWPWLPPITGNYDVFIRWAWTSGDQCYTFREGSVCGGASNTAGSWLSLGQHHLVANTSTPILTTYYNTATTLRMDAIRYVLVQADVTPREYQYVHTDALGTPIRVTDKNTTVVWQAAYDPFGAANVNDDPDGNGVRLTLNLRFPGQYYDVETGLHYNYYRDYDPGKGRYVQSDPIGIRGGLNTYAYAGGNPLGFVDPFGLCSCGLPNASTFMSNYPDYNSYTGSGVWSLIGGSLEANYGADSPGGLQNSCAARVSYGLNASGEPIPAGTPGASRNWNGDENRYIVSAEQMNNYLSGAYGPPSQTLTTADQLATLRQGLGEGGAAIVSSGGHTAVVTYDYADPYVSAYLGDVWVLPGGNCSCP